MTFIFKYNISLIIYSKPVNQFENVIYGTRVKMKKVKFL